MRLLALQGKRTADETKLEKEAPVVEVAKEEVLFDVGVVLVDEPEVLFDAVLIDEPA